MLFIFSLFRLVLYPVHYYEVMLTSERREYVPSSRYSSFMSVSQ